MYSYLLISFSSLSYGTLLWYYLVCCGSDLTTTTTTTAIMIMMSYIAVLAVNRWELQFRTDTVLSDVSTVELRAIEHRCINIASSLPPITRVVWIFLCLLQHR